MEAIRRCVERGQPYGIDVWIKRTADRLGLGITPTSPRKNRQEPENKGS